MLAAMSLSNYMDYTCLAKRVKLSHTRGPPQCAKVRTQASKTLDPNEVGAGTTVIDDRLVGE